MADEIEIPSPSAFLRPDAPPLLQKEDQPRAPKYARKASASTKSDPAKKSTLSDGAPKPKQSKSRNGCATCKQKRLKCGEEKPACLQCTRKNLQCGGYNKNFKWLPFDESNVKLKIDRQKQALPAGLGQHDRSSSVSPTFEDLPPAPTSAARAQTLATRGRPLSLDDTGSQLAGLALTKSLSPPQVSGHVTPVSPIAEVIDNDIFTSSLPLSPRAPLSDATTTPISAAPSELLLDDYRVLDSGKSGTYSGSSPTLTEILTSDILVASSDYLPFTLPDDYRLPAFGPPSDNQSINGNAHLNLGDSFDAQAQNVVLANQEERDASVERVHQAWANRYTSPPRSRSAGTLSGSARNSWLSPTSQICQQPMFADDSIEMLGLRFDKLTCGILSIIDGPSENPWRTLLWPLAQQSSALHHAVLSMTAFHSSMDVPALRLTGHEHKHRSIGYMQEGIRDNTMTDQMAIATALVLGFSESWDQHVVTGNTHIKGAQALVKRTLASHQQNPLLGLELRRLKFLCNAWVYMDVIARLTSVDSDDSNDFDNTFLFSAEAPQMVMGEVGLPGFGIDFGIGIDARLDPLMGCANTLFPLIGRVANLVKRVCRSTSTGPGIISQANDLKAALEAWEPPDFVDPPEDRTCQVQHSIQTAEAYRYATLLHLHQAVPELPELHTDDLAQKVLNYLATVPLLSRMIIVHIYPLMVAGCEATTSEDRQFVRDRWKAMGTRMRIGVIDKALMVTEEVWQRKDLYEAQPFGARRLTRTSELTFLRARGEPLKRTRSGFEGSSPGRKGIQYSWIGSATGDAGDSGKGKEPMLLPSARRATPLVANIGKMDPAYTVRGHLHWIGVMWDWEWEILL